MKHPWFIAPVLAMAWGCGGPEATPPATVPAGPFALSASDESTLIPMASGNQWVYSVEETVQREGVPDETTKNEMIWRMVNAREGKEGTLVTCEMVLGGKVVDRQVWTKSSKGFFQLTGLMDTASFSSPQPIVVFPVKQGQKADWLGLGPTPNGSVGRIKFSTEVMGPEDVDTETDRLHAIAFHSTTEFTVKGTTGHCETVSWFKPGLGLVRYRSAVAFGKTASSIVLRLKSSTVKQP